jgi:hypothetical protein
MMSDDVITPADDVVYPNQITTDFLYTFFRDAYFNVQRDEVGDVYLKDPYMVWVFPQQDGEQIRLMAQFTANTDVPRIVKLEYVNGINDKLRLLRAYVDADEDIGFDYYLTIEGGITKRAIALAVRRFSDYVRSAIQRDKDDVIR